MLEDEISPFHTFSGFWPIFKGQKMVSFRECSNKKAWHVILQMNKDRLSCRWHSWWLNKPNWRICSSKMGSSSPSFGVKIPKIFELPPPSILLPLTPHTIPYTIPVRIWLKQSTSQVAARMHVLRLVRGNLNKNHDIWLNVAKWVIINYLLTCKVLKYLE